MASDYLTFEKLPEKTPFGILTDNVIKNIICFPKIQKVVADLLIKLNEHNWSYNGIVGHFTKRYDINGYYYYSLCEIVSPDFEIYLGSNIYFNLEKMNVNLYNDGGLSMTIYIGDDWEHDKHNFWHGTNVNAKSHK